MAVRILTVKDKLDAALHDTNKPWYGVFSNLEYRTGLRRLYIFVSLVAMLGLWLVFGFGQQLVCNVVGFAYPAYISTALIEHPTKIENTKWTTYWCLYAGISVVENSLVFIPNAMPLYWLLKCIFMVWLMLPSEINGSLVIYDRLIKSRFVRYDVAVPIDSGLIRRPMKTAYILEKESTPCLSHGAMIRAS